MGGTFSKSLFSRSLRATLTSSMHTESRNCQTNLTMQFVRTRRTRVARANAMKSTTRARCDVRS